MNTNEKNVEILLPRSQLILYGYNNYFHSFIKLYKDNKLPNVILLNGLKGSGKSTFIYHFVNYILSQDEQNKYCVDNFEINKENLTYKFIKNNTHPNFFLLENDLPDSDIKIDRVRELLKFLNKSSYSQKPKIILIDNADYLNINSSNSLLHCLEEPPENTFFFIINSNLSKLANTIRSRCIEYKFHFSLSDKKIIFNKIAQFYGINYEDCNFTKFLNFDTPVNILIYALAFKESNLTSSEDNLPFILYLIEKLKNKKDSNLLNYISIFIEHYYNHLSLQDMKNLNDYFVKKNKILYLINDMKNFNLDKKNMLITIDNILKA